MSKIVLSAGVRQNLLSLQTTAELMASTQVRLATGKKVNSALDNPTNFFTSASLQSRAGDLNSLLDSMSVGIKTLEATDNGIKSITKTIEGMQSTLRQARQDKSFKTESYAMNLPTPLTGSETVSFSGGAVGTTPVTINLTALSGGPSAASIAGGAFTAMNFSGIAPMPAALTAGADYVDIDLSANADNEFSFTLNGETIALLPADGTAGVIDIDQAVTAIQDRIDNNVNLAGTVTVSRGSGTDGNKLVFTSTGTGSSETITIAALTASGTGVNATTADLGFTNGDTASGDDAITRSLTFDLDLDGSVTPISIDLAAVQAVGDNDDVLTAAELATIINTQAGATIATASGGGIAITSPTTGTTSTLGIANLTATNITNTSGLVNGTAQGAAASGAIVARSVDSLVTEINNHADLNGKIRASNDNGRLRIENQSTGELTITGIDGTGAVDGGTNTATVGGNEVRKNLVNQFNELRDQLDKLADDASFNGINLLRGDLLKITFNETGTSTIEIRAKDIDGNEASVNAAQLNIFSLVDSQVDSDGSIDSLLLTLSDALNTIRSHASNFGSNLSVVQNRTEFTKSMINTLQTGADTLVLADTNEEAANMLALQTRQQLSSTALSLASQADQAVLRLFG